MKYMTTSQQKMLSDEDSMSSDELYVLTALVKGASELSEDIVCEETWATWLNWVKYVREETGFTEERLEIIYDRDFTRYSSRYERMYTKLEIKLIFLDSEHLLKVNLV